MKIAVVGCLHGKLDDLYETLREGEKRNEFSIDLVLVCGDFQACRDENDLRNMAVPQKYLQMGDFVKYWSGEKKAPYLTIFIGGNHEASNHLWELYYGGWVAPNIYYLGHSGVVRFGGLRIAGCSGIYKAYDYSRGYYETIPYTDSHKRSAYHVRNYEVFKLLQLTQPVDIFLSHDWPQGIMKYGNSEQLFRFKPYFRAEQSTMGNPAYAQLLSVLKPRYWFAAHLHCKFAAFVNHQDGSLTHFLALNKLLPGRHFLQVFDIPSPEGEAHALFHDPEWLCVVHSTFPLLPLGKNPTPLPSPASGKRYDFRPTHALLQTVITGVDSLQNRFEHSNISQRQLFLNRLVSVLGPLPSGPSGVEDTENCVNHVEKKARLTTEEVDLDSEGNAVESKKDLVDKSPHHEEIALVESEEDLMDCTPHHEEIALVESDEDLVDDRPYHEEIALIERDEEPIDEKTHREIALVESDEDNEDRQGCSSRASSFSVGRTSENQSGVCIEESSSQASERKTFPTKLWLPPPCNSW